jgi:hypothetical protein
MTLNNFEVWRDAQLKAGSPVRLDGMSPLSAMKGMASEDVSVEGYAATDMARVLGMGDRLGIVKSVPGVRSALTDIFRHHAQKGWALYLPECADPFYNEAASEHFSDLEYFNIYPSPDFSILSDASGPSLALISAPLSPLGRQLSESEIDTLLEWLEGDFERTLVLDTSYSYTGALDSGIWKLWDSDQVIILSSLSKSHLKEGVYGVAIVPIGLSEVPELAQASPEAHAVALGALSTAGECGPQQQALFVQAWEHLRPSIEKMTGEPFAVPENGYMAVIPVSYKTALENHNCLCVPLSVFGSQKDDACVVTCLHSIQEIV